MAGSLGLAVIKVWEIWRPGRGRVALQVAFFSDSNFVFPFPGWVVSTRISWPAAMQRTKGQDNKGEESSGKLSGFRGERAALVRVDRESPPSQPGIRNLVSSRKLGGDESFYFRGI